MIPLSEHTLDSKGVVDSSARFRVLECGGHPWRLGAFAWDGWSRISFFRELRLSLGRDGSDLNCVYERAPKRETFKDTFGEGLVLFCMAIEYPNILD